MIAWTREKISGLDDAKLANLRANALAKNPNDLITMSDKEIASRPIKASRRRSARTLTVDQQRSAEAEAAAQLTALAKTLNSRFDLTAATAKRLSVGTKGFRAVELLGKNGTAKIGGMKLKGVIAIDRYISYRCKNDRASLGYILLKDKAAEEALWMQDQLGLWLTYTRVSNNQSHIANEMKNMARMHPNRRTRAVDESGRVVDIL
jgi:hypothetical protein